MTHALVGAAPTAAATAASKPPAASTGRLVALQRLAAQAVEPDVVELSQWATVAARRMAAVPQTAAVDSAVYLAPLGRQVNAYA
ncbi:MAG: hypothetical protein CFE45_15195 [Burkholderiales bacterium PBB5]|nr:MAG: hypothetical protein CFE45_15195 [Burkholderiales bacterium PBB5]